MNRKFKLPTGARLLKRQIRRKIGSWVEMEYDAEVKRLGLTWYRAAGGFGGRHDRQDWVADIPDGCLSVSQSAGDSWRDGFDAYKSFDAAVIGETRKQLSHAKSSLYETQIKLSREIEAVELIASAVRRIRKE